MPTPRALALAAALLAAPTALAQSADPTATDPDAGAGASRPPPPDVSQLPFSPDTVRQVLAYHQPDVQACYEQFLARRNKRSEGRLATVFTITPEGLVKGARVDRKGTTLNLDLEMRQCVVQVLSAMTFPRPQDQRDHPVEYPFNLKAIR